MKIVLSRNKNSIRHQLLMWLIIPLFCLFISSVYSNYYRGSETVDRAYDYGLKQIARAVAGQVEYEHGRWTLATPLLSQDLLKTDGKIRIYFRITDAREKMIGGTKEIGLPPKAQIWPQFRDAMIHGQKVRIVAIRFPLKHGRRRNYMIIQVAETSQERDSMINNIFNNVLQQLALMFLGAISVWIGVSRSLSPLEKISHAIALQSPSNLEPIYESYMPTEIQPLIQTFNTLILKLESYISAQQCFIANASHQLKTPLSGLQLQLDLLERIALPESTQPIIKQMQDSLARSAHLVQQLVTLSRAESAQLLVVPLKPLDLLPLAAELVESFVPFALSKKIDLGFEAQEGPIFILGNVNSIRDMVSNLLDNAIRYTPANGQVTLHLNPGACVTLTVQDSGPGIPPAETVKVFERFYRLQDHQSAGSGLGLAIVKEIAVTHYAKVNILNIDGVTGTSIQIVFPNIS